VGCGDPQFGIDSREPDRRSLRGVLVWSQCRTVPGATKGFGSHKSSGAATPVSFGSVTVAAASRVQPAAPAMAWISSPAVVPTQRPQVRPWRELLAYTVTGQPHDLEDAR